MTTKTIRNHAGLVGLVLLLAGGLTAMGVGERIGGNAEIVYESLNAGGAGFATNTADTLRLGGSLGQGGMMVMGTNVYTNIVLTGFWKAEDGCTLYPVDVTDFQMGTNELGLTFTVINSNRYRVLYVTEEEGGIPLGAHAFTNEAVAAFEAQGSMGSVTTVWMNVSAATNQARFYLIECE